MDTNIVKIYLAIGILLLVLLGFGIYYALQPILNAPVDESPLPFIGNTPSGPLGTGHIAGALEDVEKYVRAGIAIYAKDAHTVLVTWQNLPEGTSKLNLFREKIGSSKWAFWQTISIGSSSGETTLTLSGNENANNYTYYGQAYSSSGSTLWASRPTEVATTPPPGLNLPPGQSGSSAPLAPPGTPPSGTPPPPPAASSFPTPPAPPATPPPSSSSTPPPPPAPGPPPPPPPPTGIPYYGPNGQISGYLPFQTPSFWATHSDTNHIEIGWQNLPPPTTLIIISRAASSTGPWAELLRQTTPDTAGPPSIRLIDLTLYNPYYYKMDAYMGTKNIATYGPALLPGLGQ